MTTFKEGLQKLSSLISKYYENFEDLIVLIQAHIKKNIETGNEYISKNATPIKILIPQAIRQLIKSNKSLNFSLDYDLAEELSIAYFNELIEINKTLKNELISLFSEYKNIKFKLKNYCSKDDQILEENKKRIFKCISKILEIISITKKNGYFVLTFEDARYLRLYAKFVLELAKAILKKFLYQTY